MTQVLITVGIYADENANFRDALPRNLVVVPKSTGVSTSYLKTSPGIVQFSTGPGTDRGGINWNGLMYRAMGSKLVRIDDTGTVTELGDIGAGGYCVFDYGFDRLAVWSGGRLYYYTTSGIFVQVTDSDLGLVKGGCWIAGYFVSTDSTNIIVTELNDPTSVDPLKYGSSESDADPIMTVRKLQGQIIAFNRNTIETYANVGGTGFPFQVSQGAQVATGAIGTNAVAEFGGTFAFVGSSRNAPPSVYMMGSGTAEPIATREIEQILATYSEQQLSAIVVESQSDNTHKFLYIHLPDKTLIFDLAASQALKQPIWLVRNSGLTSTDVYRMRGLVYVYGKWIGGDPTTSYVGSFSDTTTNHYSSSSAWEFSTPIVYNEAKSAIIHELQLITLPGRVPLSENPTVRTSYSHDGESWSQEFSVSAGKQGDHSKRISWRTQGMLRSTRVQRFRGESKISISALEMIAEPLSAGG